MARPDRAATDDVPGLAARRIAAEIIDGVLRRHRALDEQLDGAGANAGLSGLADRDRALTRALVAVRAAPARHAAASDRTVPRARAAGEGPAGRNRAADRRRANSVSSTCPITPRSISPCGWCAPTATPTHFAGLVNAVLRRIAREGAGAARGARSPLLDTPAWLMARWIDDLRRGDGAAPSRWRNATSRRSISPSKAIPRAGRRSSAAGCCRPDRCARSRTGGHGAAGFRRGRVVGAGCRGGTAGAAARRGRRPSRRRSLRGARRQDRAACRRRRPRHRGRPLAGAARPPARKSRAAFARRRAGQRRCRGMEGRTVRRRAARRAVLVDRHHPPPSRHSVAQAPRPTSRSSPTCSDV